MLLKLVEDVAHHLLEQGHVPEELSEAVRHGVSRTLRLRESELGDLAVVNLVNFE